MLAGGAEKSERPGREEGAVEVAEIVVDGAAAAVAPGQADAVARQVRQVGLGPRILVAADDDAGRVAPQQQHAPLVETPMAVHPVLQRQVREDVVALRLVDEPPHPAAGRWWRRHGAAPASRRRGQGADSWQAHHRLGA